MLIPSARLFLIVAGICLAAEADTPLADARSTLAKWVETRQLLSKTRADWQASKEMLRQSADLFERELLALETEKSKLTTNNAHIDKERLAAEASKLAADETLSVAREFASRFENEIRRVVPGLPAPLQEALEPLLRRLPTDSRTKMTAAERLQVLVGILNEIDKFNSAISLFNEKRRNGAGEEIGVETCYVGLGAAYFVNEAGDFAGTGTAGVKGWEWQVRNDLAPAIRETIRIYRNEKPAHFVALPATIQ